MLTFSMKSPSLVDRNGVLCPSNSSLLGIFAGFNYAGRFKSKRRPERLFDIDFIKHPVDDGCGKLDVWPFVMTRPSPVAMDPDVPAVSGSDSVKATAVWDKCDLMSSSHAVPDLWNRDTVAFYAKSYPFPVVSMLANQVVSAKGLRLKFHGDMSKPVIRRNSPTIAGREMEIREHLMKEVVASRMTGPYSRPPFPSNAVPMQPRNCPLKTAPKKKHDPLNRDFRLVSNFAAGRPSAVNNLVWSPKLVGFHPRARHIRDKLAMGGKRMRVWTADIPKCFRRNCNPPELLALFLYTIVTAAFGVEWFVDHMNPFGWGPSEWGHQCNLGVIRWSFLEEIMPPILSYVDNFFMFVPSAEELSASAASLVRLLLRFGIELHEVQDSGIEFVGLGWMWAVGATGWVMRCCEDKFVIICAYLRVWSASRTATLDLATIRIACGVLSWISEGWPMGRSDVAPLWHMRTAGEAILARQESTPPDKIRIKISAAV